MLHTRRKQEHNGKKSLLYSYDIIKIIKSFIHQKTNIENTYLLNRMF